MALDDTEAAAGIPGPIFTSTGSTPADAARSIPRMDAFALWELSSTRGIARCPRVKSKNMRHHDPLVPKKAGPREPKAESPPGTS